MKTDSQFYDTEGSVRLNLLEVGRVALQLLWITKHFPSRHRFTKWHPEEDVEISRIVFNYRYLISI